MGLLVKVVETACTGRAGVGGGVVLVGRCVLDLSGPNGSSVARRLGSSFG